MECTLITDHVLFQRDPMIYGQFLEHFHRQIYSGIYDPASPLADEDGFRTDVIEALKNIRVPIIRWPGGCFVSAYHWENGVGRRTPVYDKAWRVEEPNTFGTDEFVKFCRKLECEPYICTNAGTGTPEEMSSWMEYCNLKNQGPYAKMRISNGFPDPHAVRYWSIGNENYGSWEIGAKTSQEWSHFVTESAKMMRRVDPTAELSAAALSDIDWNLALLKAAGPYLKWISIHAYWDPLASRDTPAGYEKCMGYTADLESQIRKVRGLLNALGYEKQIRIAFDEWNLRGWHHPNIHGTYQGVTEEEYLLPRDRNDRNETYTMADAVFTACVLNMFLRNADIVGMANFSPAVNTRGMIFTYPEGIVKRTTYYVFELYTRYMFEEVLPLWTGPAEEMQADGQTVPVLDVTATRSRATGKIAIAAVNKHPGKEIPLSIHMPAAGNVTMKTLNGDSKDSYNDIGRESAVIRDMDCFTVEDSRLHVLLPPHSVSVLQIQPSA